jgi:hypothetical protein
MTDDQQIVNDLRSRLFEKAIAEGIDALNEKPRSVYLIVELEVFTMKDGLVGFYTGMGGDRAIEVVAALQHIGAIQSADLIRRANELFPDGRPPADRLDVHDELNCLDEDTWKSINDMGHPFLDGWDDYGMKLRAYIVANRAQLAEGL